MAGELVQLFCLANCGAYDRVPAFVDRDEKDPEKRVKPVQGHPFICLSCWRAGWRHVNGELFQLPGHPQVVG